MTRHVLSLLFVSVVLAWPSPSSAQGQPWLVDRRFGEGIGIRLGNLELHPSIAGEVGFDSNYFQGSGQNDRDASGNPTVGAGQTVHSEPHVPIMRFRGTPSLTLSTLRPQRRRQNETPPKVDFSTGVSATYNEFLSMDSQYASQVRDQRFLTGEASTKLDWLRGRPVSGDVSAAVTRAVQPNNDPLFGTDQGDTRAAFRRTMYRGGLGFDWKPGGGLLDWRLAYGFGATVFSEPAFKPLDTVNHNLQFRGRWLFFPRTALLYFADAGLLTYPNQTDPPTQVGGKPVSTQLGLKGLVSNHFAMLATAGYAWTLYDELPGVPAQNYSGVIGKGEVTWYPLPEPTVDASAASVGFSSLNLGYRHGVSNSYLGNYYTDDTVYARSNYLIAGVLVLSGDASFAFIGRPNSYFSDGTLQQPAFTEQRATLTAFGEYRMSDSHGYNATLRYSSSLGDHDIPLVNPLDLTASSPRPMDNLHFVRFEIFVGSRWFM